MNSQNRRKQWIGVVGMSGLALLLFVNAANVAVHMASGRGSLGLGIPLAAAFLAGSAWFAKLALEKARYLSRH